MHKIGSLTLVTIALIHAQFETTHDRHKFVLWPKRLIFSR